MELESGDIVLCTVDRIVGTTVFVHIEGDGEGSIVFSEIAPGRIRNIRDYVFPKKRIVCKVLRVSGDRVDLSLRRVTLKEQKEIKEKGKLEKSYESIIKSVLGDRAERALQEVQKKGCEGGSKGAGEGNRERRSGKNTGYNKLPTKEKDIDSEEGDCTQEPGPRRDSRHKGCSGRHRQCRGEISFCRKVFSEDGRQGDERVRPEAQRHSGEH